MLQPQIEVYASVEDQCYIELVKLVNLAEARSVTVDLQSEKNVFKARNLLRQLLLDDYAKCKLLRVQEDREQEIREFKESGRNQQVSFSLTEIDLKIEDFLEDAKNDLDFDLTLVSNNPCDQNPCREYYKFHQK